MPARRSRSRRGHFQKLLSRTWAASPLLWIFTLLDNVGKSAAAVSCLCPASHDSHPAPRVRPHLLQSTGNVQTSLDCVDGGRHGDNLKPPPPGPLPPRPSPGSSETPSHGGGREKGEKKTQIGPCLSGWLRRPVGRKSERSCWARSGGEWGIGGCGFSLFPCRRGFAASARGV